MSSGKRVAKTDGKLKKAAGAVWSFVKGYLSFQSSSFCRPFHRLQGDYGNARLVLYRRSEQLHRSLPYLTALIAFLQAATATVLSFSLNKSKAENTTGGITYEANIKRDC